MHVEPGILEIDAIGFLVDHEAVEAKSIIVALKTHVVLPQAAQQGGQDLIDFLISKRSPIKLALRNFFAYGVIILASKDKVEVLFV